MWQMDPHMHENWFCDCHKSLRNMTLHQSALKRKELNSGQASSHRPGDGILAKTILLPSRSLLALVLPPCVLTLDKGSPSSKQGQAMQDP